MKRLICVAISLLGLFTLVSCGSGNSQNKGNTLKVALGSDITSTAPYTMTDNNSYNVGYNTFEGLFTQNPITAEAVYGIAKDYSVSEDGLIFTFHLKDNITFSDGEPITAKIIEDSWKYSLSPVTASLTGYMLADVLKNGNEVYNGEMPIDKLGVKAIDEKTLEVELAFPAPYFIDILTLPISYPLPMHIIKEKGSKWNQSYPIVSNGPFVITSWRPNSEVVVEKNERYHDAENIHLDRIIFYTLDDTNTAYNMYLNNEVDFLMAISTDKVEEAIMRDDFHSFPYVNGSYYFFNMETPALKDVRVRQALAKAIDRKTLVEKILKTGDKPLYSVMNGMPGYKGPVQIKENISEAQQLLAAAGYPAGKDFPTLDLLYNTNENNKIVAEYLQQQWKQNLGINVTLRNEEWKTFLSTRSNFNYNLMRMGWVPDYPDPYAMLDVFTAAAGYTNYKSKKYDNMLNEANRIGDPQKRMRALEVAEAQLMEDVPFIPILYNSKNTLFNQNKWDGIYVNPSSIAIFRDVKLKE